MIRQLLILFTGLILSASLYAQMKVGGNPVTINPNSIFEMESANKGMLLPRIALTSTASASPMSAHVAGMTIYNTATVNDVTPGVYYNDGAKWVPTGGGAVSTNNWSLNGNGGTNPTINYLGTSDATDLSIQTNATERMRISASGNVGIGTNNPQAKLHVNGQAIISNLPAGTASDSIVTVDPVSGLLRSVAPGRLGSVQKVIYSATQGQQLFATPNTITDVNKIFFYRNGVLINCTASGSNAVISEVTCDAGDEVKIVQF